MIHDSKRFHTMILILPLTVMIAFFASACAWRTIESPLPTAQTTGPVTGTAGSASVPMPTGRPTLATGTAVTAPPVSGTTVTKPSGSTSATASAPAQPGAGVTMKRDLLVLMSAYPDTFTGIEKTSADVWLVTRAGSRLLYDDRRAKSTDEELANADLQDTLAQAYPLRSVHALMPVGTDPGRIRSYALLDALYGSSETERQAQLMPIAFAGQALLFHKAHDAYARLQAAAAQVEALAKRQPAVGTYAYPSSGTWNNRAIAGTTRLSAHAYGIAIDLHAHPDDYWISATPEAGAKRLAGYPPELVRAFEDNGFIWGGKWNSFDIMHYEYRPEILLKARWFSGAFDPSRPWHQGVGTPSPSVANTIALIDRSLG